MGARLSARSSSRIPDEDPNKPDEVQTSLEPARRIFYSSIQRTLSKKLSSAGHLRLEIKGQVEKYPFWISSSNLREKGNSQKQIEYYEISADKVLKPCAPKLPNNLHCELNKTVRLLLKHRKSSISESKQDSYPEHDIILRSVTKLLLHISINENDSRPTELKVQVYEHHRTLEKRRRPLLHLREMKVEKVLFDSNNNMAIMGTEFALIIYKAASDQEHVVEHMGGITGVYMRTLDTYPTGMLIYDYRQAGTNNVDVRLPATITHSHEYAKRLLNRTSSKPFRVKLARIK